MRLLQWLYGMVSLCLAAWLCIPAAFQAWQLLSLPRNSARQPHLEFSIGSFTLGGWAFVGTLGCAGLLLAITGLYVLTLRETDG
jgi:hypothetical protein